MTKDNSLKRLCTLCLALLLLTAGSVAAQPPETAVIKTASGLVSIIRENGVYRGKPATPLQNKDFIVTGTDGFAGLLFRDGSMVTIGPSSEFQIRDYRFDPEQELYLFNLYMNKGSLIYNSGRIGKLSPESVRLTTPEATVGIRGTRFILDLK
jgi:hypothetical protein